MEHAASDYSNANAHAVAPIAPPYARAREIAWRGSYTAHCANGTDVATQRMSTCRSQCDGDRIHPEWGGRDLLRLFGRLLLGHRLLGLPNQNEAAELQSPARANPHPDFGGPKRSREGRVKRALKFGPCNGAGVQVRDAKRDGDTRWRRACDAWGVQPSVAARR